MDTNTDNLKRLIEVLKTMSFWQRLFSWQKIKQLLVDAAADLQKFISGADNWKEKYNELRNDNERLHSELSLSKVNAAQQAREVEELRQAAYGHNQKITELSATISATEQIIENPEKKLP
jgi:uncharacterized coiled-coil DUF342 family protein